MKARIAIGAIAALTVAQHTTAQSTQQQSTAQGIMYFLPKRDLVVQITRELTGCSGIEVRARQSAEIISEPLLEDAERQYFINLDSLNRFFTANNMTVTLTPTGVIAGVKNQSTDKTAEFIGAVVGAGAKLVTAAAGFPTGLIKAAEAAGQLCNEETRKALEKAEKGPEELEKLAADLREMKKKLATLKQDQAEYKTLSAQIADAEAKNEKLGKDIPLAKQYLRRVDAYRFSAGADRLMSRLDPSSATVRAWFSDTGLNTFVDKAAKSAYVCANEPVETNQACREWDVVPRALTTYIGVIKPAGSQGHYPASGSDPSGIVYRQPRSTEVRVCARQECIDHTGTLVARRNAGELILLDVRALPQFGQVGILPYGKAGIFQSLTVDIEAHETGGVKKIIYTNSARSEKAAEALTKSIEEVAKLRELKEKEKTQDLKRQKDELTAQKEVLDAETAKLEAEKKLRKAREEAGK